MKQSYKHQPYVMYTLYFVEINVHRTAIPKLHLVSNTSDRTINPVDRVIYLQRGHERKTLLTPIKNKHLIS